MKQLIRSNIESSGRHLYAVQGGESPRFLYTIGMTETLGYELVLAGCATLPTPIAGELLNRLARELEGGANPDTLLHKYGPGKFRLGPVHPSWVDKMLLGALDYYDRSDIPARQVVAESRTIDQPDMALPYNPISHPVWKWLDGGWPHAVSSDAIAITNLDALQGHSISELTRWEENEWEIFSGPGPEVPQDQLFMVPLATLLAFDPSLEPALNLKLGTGLYREHGEDGRAGPWQEWVTKGL